VVDIHRRLTKEQMAAGLANQLLEMEDIVILIGEFRAAGKHL
jgi:hypothetical protein